MNIMRDHVISNGVIGHGKKPDWSVLEVVSRLRRKISTSTDILGRVKISVIYNGVR